MTQTELVFDGSTYDPALDGERLGRQLDRVRDLLLGHMGEWFTLAELQRAAGGSEAGVSARIRDLRKERNGGHDVQRRRRSTGTWEYGTEGGKLSDDRSSATDRSGLLLDQRIR